MASRLRAHYVRRTTRTIGLVAALIVVIGLVSLLVVHAFTIQRVEVDGDGIAVELDREKLGTNLLAVPTDRLTKELLAAYPLLADVRFEKRLPGTLIVHLVRRAPFAMIQTGGNIYTLGEEGVVLDAANETGLYPVIYIDIGALPVGSTVRDGRIRSVLAFLSAFSGTARISQVRVKDDTSFQLRLEDSVVYLPSDGDMRGKATTLQTIIEGFRIKGTLPSVIDLRFSKPVITNN